MNRQVFRLMLGLVPMLFAAGCTGWQPPKAWDKEVLAHPTMRIGGDDALDERMRQHVYVSREQALGGGSIGGGGCGCN